MSLLAKIKELKIKHSIILINNHLEKCYIFIIYQIFYFYAKLEKIIKIFAKYKSIGMN